MKGTELSLRIAVTQAIAHGTKFIVSDSGEIEVRNPERMPADVRNLLCSRWFEASEEIIARETLIRIGGPHHCESCGTEIGR